jgi:hypothetical protein
MDWEFCAVFIAFGPEGDGELMHCPTSQSFVNMLHSAVNVASHRFANGVTGPIVIAVSISARCTIYPRASGWRVEHRIVAARKGRVPLGRGFPSRTTWMNGVDAEIVRLPIERQGRDAPFASSIVRVAYVARASW